MQRTALRQEKAATQEKKIIKEKSIEWKVLKFILKICSPGNNVCKH